MASKEKNLEELMAEAQALLNERKPRKKRKVEFQFHRDSVTGQRTSKYKYHRRVKSATDRLTLQSQSDLEDHEVFREDTTDDQQQDDRSLHSLLTKCQDVLDSFHSVPNINWEKRMASLNENWEALRPSIFKSILQLEGCGLSLNAHHCELCNHVSWQIRCIECGGKRMCSECDASIHQYLPFHDREALLDGSLRSIPPTFTVNNAGLLEETRKHLLYDLMSKICPHCHQEGTFEICASPGFIIVVNQKGRFDFNNYHMSCSSCGYKVDPCSLDRMIAAGYWPGSPKDSSYFFDQNLFWQWDFLQKPLPGTSEVSFLRALGDFSQSNGRAPTITANTFSCSFKEWKFCMHEVELSQGLSWMVCPACALKQHSCHVDGNAKLYRYKSSGTQKRPCYYGESLIADKADVDRHIKDVYSKVPRSKNANDSMCGNSHWRAAGNRARKKNKLDETGLEIAGCRHGLAQWAVYMYQGEIYGYAHYLQCKKMLPAGVNFFWEDVVCKYWKWAAKVGGPATTVMKPALSVMHAKGHKWSCQVLWGGHWQDGSASTTGEEVEQINAHVSRCANTTKYMLPEGRNEALTEQIFGWNRRKIFDMVTNLVKRYTRAAKMCDSSNKDIDAVLTEFNIGRKALNLNEWKAQVVKIAKEEQLTANSRGELSELSHLKRQMEMLCFSIAQSTVAITKLADSSKQRTRLRRNIDSNKKQLQCMIEKFNALPANAGKTQVSLASLLAGGELPDDVAQSSDIPIRVKSKVVDAFQIHSRWLEEVNLLKEEMFNFLKFYAEIRIPALREEIVKIEDEIKAQAEFEEQERDPCTVSSLKSSGSSADTAMGTVKYSCLDKHTLVLLGKVALLRKGLFFCQDQLNRGFNSFQKILCENGGNLNEYNIVADKDASVTVENSGVEIDRNGGDEDDDHDLENDDDSDGDDDEDTNSDDDNESPLLFSTCNLEINVPMRPCLSGSGVCIWDFPCELSQSTFQGRNGSNACNIIALLLAQGIHKTNCDLFPSPFLRSDWVALVCGCIKVGNAIYDRSRGSLPHRYLSAGEAAMIAGDVLDVSVGQPKPVRVNDPHVPSTLRFHLLELCNSSVTSYAVLIVNEKTVLFVSFPGETLVLIDSHLHGQTGAMVVLGNRCNVDEFVRVVGESVGFNSSTFGNLVQLSF